MRNKEFKKEAKSMIGSLKKIVEEEVVEKWYLNLFFDFEGKIGKEIQDSVWENELWVGLNE